MDRGRDGCCGDVTSVVSHRPMRILPVGIVRASDYSCSNAVPRRPALLAG